jgi:DnaJ-class molecular chaperone
MIQQMQTQCNVCDGRGETIADKDKCAECRGERTVKESKTLEVAISTGMKHGQRITFRGEGDQHVRTHSNDRPDHPRAQPIR